MKTKLIMITTLLAFCMAFAFAGCGSSESDNSGDTASTQQTSGSGCDFDFPHTGFGFDLPEGMEITKGYYYPYDMGDVNYNSGVMMSWPVYADVPEDTYKNLTDEEHQNVHTGSTFSIICVKDAANEDEAIEKCISVRKEIAAEEGEEYSEAEEEVFRSFKQIHAQDGYIWLAYKPAKTEGIREECQEEYSTLFDAADEMISSMKFYTPQRWTGTEEGADIAFEDTDLDGNPVNSAQIFSQNKVTMINIWATTCGPCIQEMPELEKLNKEFQKKGGAIIGVVRDVPADNNMYLQEAQAIVKDTGVTFLNLKAWDSLEDDLEIVGTPTTYFVDSKGNLIGEPVLGAHLEVYKKQMEKYLSQAE